ncbi:MAG: 60S ribosomal export protein NMD3 [Candidatus Thorarchaeota archaeon SMTZ1-45]
MKPPCYQCGEPAVVDGLCADCYDKEHPLIEVKTPLTLLSCRKCGAVKIPGGWKKLSVEATDSDDLWPHQVDVLLDHELKPLVSGVEITIEEEKRLDRVLSIVLKVIGKSHDTLPPHEEQHNVEVRFSYGTCDTCGMMSGGYYEATLQIRADGRKLTEEEEDDIVRIVTEMTVAEYGTNEKAFVTKISTDKYGIDFQLGSEHLCRSIADVLEYQYLAQRKQNYKLVGQDKGGKDKFRITILIRLNRFGLGDFVRVLDNPCQVMAMGKSGLTCFDLVQKQRFTINPKSSKWRTIEYLASKDERRKYMVTTRVYGQPVQLMDSETFEITELDEFLLDNDTDTGATVYGLIIDEEFFLLPRE